MTTEQADSFHLEDLLSTGQSKTEAAEMINVEGSSAQRFKKIIQQTSDSQRDLNLKKGVLEENAVVLQVTVGRMSHEDQLRVRHA